MYIHFFTTTTSHPGLHAIYAPSPTVAIRLQLKGIRPARSTRYWSFSQCGPSVPSLTSHPGFSRSVSQRHGNKSRQPTHANVVIYNLTHQKSTRAQYLGTHTYDCSLSLVLGLPAFAVPIWLSCMALSEVDIGWDGTRDASAGLRAILGRDPGA
jgi:hypothetical protein